MAYVKTSDHDWNTVIDKRPPSIQLRDAQRLWLKLRDADCDVHFSTYHRGTIRVTKSIVCRTKHTEARTKFLKSLLPRH